MFQEWYDGLSATQNEKCNVASRCEFLGCWPVKVDTIKPLATERNMAAGSLERYRLCVLILWESVYHSQ